MKKRSMNQIIEFATGLKGKNPIRNIFINRVQIESYRKRFNNKDIYVSIFSYETDDPKKGKLQGDFVIDFDSPDDLNRSREDLIKVVRFLKKRWQIPSEYLRIYFSGKKGFHLEVNRKIFGNPAKKNLDQIYKQLAQSLPNPNKTIDFKIYERRRLWRLPNSIHPESKLYKIPLSFSAITALSKEKIKSLAQAPGDIILEEKNIKIIPEAVERLKEYEEERVTIPYKADSSMNTGLSEIYPCLHQLITKAVPEGDRNNATYLLSCFFRQRNFNKDKTLSQIQSWNLKNNPPLPEDEISRTVESAFGQEKVGIGCNNPLLVKRCVKEKCPRFKTKIIKALLEQIPQKSFGTNLIYDLLPVFKELSGWNDQEEAGLFIRSDISQRFGIKKKQNINDLQKAYQKIKNEYDQEQEKTVSKMSEEEKEEALAFLKSATLIDDIKEDLTKVGYVGEDINKLALYLVATSRKLKKPLNAILKGPSSVGKSALEKAVKILMPKEEVFYKTRMTKEALAYLPTTALKNKWVIITELGGMEDSSYNLKIMISEYGLETALPVMDPKTHQLSTETKRIEGPFAFTTTTTKAQVNEELSTRTIELFCDMSEEQTSKILEFQKKMQTLEFLLQKQQIPKIARKHINAQKLLRPIEVICEFSEFIDFPFSRVRARRDHLQFFELIKVVAFLRQYQKEVKIEESHKEKTEYIEADCEDYAIAYELAKDIFKNTLDELNKHSRWLLEQLRKMVLEKNCGETFTRRDIRKYTRKNDKFLKDYMPQLEDLEYVDVSQKGRGKTTLYLCKSLLIEQEPSALKNLTTPEELKGRIKSTSTK